MYQSLQASPRTPIVAIAARAAFESPIAVDNGRGRGPLLLLCEHASNRIPAAYGALGLADPDIERHIAWDIGALGLARQLSALLDAPLAHATYSRLLLDLNRDVSAPDSIVEHSEDTAIPGNVALPSPERRLRQQALYEPFHREVDALISRRLAEGLHTAVLSIHSFTPRYNGVERPWHVGVISQDERTLADAMLAALRCEPGLVVGDNEPYGPQDGVFHSVGRHGQSRGLPCAMIEVRNDLLADEPAQRQWAERLQRALQPALSSPALLPGNRE
jgi:predicted N-formylglutamate amidohydrolase